MQTAAYLLLQLKMKMTVMEGYPANAIFFSSVFLLFFPWSFFLALLVCTVPVHFPSLSTVFFFLCSSSSIIFVFVCVFCAPLQFYLASGLIVPCDLPDDKMRGNSQVQVVSLFQATCPMIKCEETCKWSHCSRRPARWWKYIFFFCGLILVGGLSRLKFLKGEKFPKAISNLDLSRWPSIWWISSEISLAKFAKLVVPCLKV